MDNSISIYNEHKNFWNQIFKLSIIELKKSYKGTLFGILWIIIKPLVTLTMFWFIFEFGIRSNAPIMGISKFDFMAVGFVSWFYMQDVILGGVHCLRRNKAFVCKIKFPVSTLMTIMVLSRAYVHFVLLGALYLYMIIKGMAPSIYNIQILFYFPLMVMFFLFVSWTTALYGAYSKDFENTIQAFIQGVFWISGILWNTYDIQNEGLRLVMLFNPVNYFVNGYRKCFLYHEWFFQSEIETYIFLGELIFVFFFGIYNYHRLRKNVADMI